ncbi:MAG: tetratricopeptide repeat protein [Candidatus Omnitrophica bacterium]|jgi:tetratricopeptide (TPR) repeat protein|nr:tetratricopeptide repeat protein [Candidatus Omnitrophota bacterium]
MVNKYRLLISFCVTLVFTCSAFINNSLCKDTSEGLADSKLTTATNLLYKREFNLAIEKLNQILTIDQKSPKAWYNLACAHALAGDYENALLEFEKALQFAPSDFKAIILINKALICLKLQSYDSAFELLNKAIELVPRLERIDDFRGLHFITAELAKGNLTTEKINFWLYEDSPFLFDTACFIKDITTDLNLKVYNFSNLEPLPLFFYGSSRTHLLLGKLHYLDNRLDEAESEFKAAYFLSKDNEALKELSQGTAYFWLGHIAFKRQQFMKALQLFKKAAQIQPNNFGYVREVAAGYMANQHYLIAKEKCQEALSLNPHDENTKELLKLIEEREKAAAKRINR